MMLFMAALGGSLLGFLFYNFNPGSILTAPATASSASRRSREEPPPPSGKLPLSGTS
jgi:hypothetical protein